MTTKCKIYLDTEFNGFNGHLISMALVAECGAEWYRVLPCAHPTKWVMQNVIPVLNKSFCAKDFAPASHRLTVGLGRWLRQFQSLHIIADCPADLQHFCRALMLDRGLHILTPPLTLELFTDTPSASWASSIPHNALEDARALRRLAAGSSQRGR